MLKMTEIKRGFENVHDRELGISKLRWSLILINLTSNLFSITCFDYSNNQEHCWRWLDEGEEILSTS